MKRDPRADREGVRQRAFAARRPLSASRPLRLVAVEPPGVPGRAAVAVGPERQWRDRPGPTLLYPSVRVCTPRGWGNGIDGAVWLLGFLTLR
jgi:hypothetical protein